MYASSNKAEQPGSARELSSLRNTAALLPVARVSHHGVRLDGEQRSHYNNQETAAVIDMGLYHSHHAFQVSKLAQRLICVSYLSLPSEDTESSELGERFALVIRFALVAISHLASLNVDWCSMDVRLVTKV